MPELVGEFLARGTNKMKDREMFIIIFSSAIIVLLLS
jgi:hypothetical protein